MSTETKPCDLGGIAARIRPFVARRVAPDDVDDVLQEILMRVHQGFDGIDDETHFARWLQRVASTVVVDHHRRGKRLGRKHASFRAESSASEVDDEDAAAELATFVAAFIAMLASPYREALTLTEIEGLTMRQAAEREGLSESGMKSRVQRGRRLLREMFEACCEIALDARGRVVEYTPRPGAIARELFERAEHVFGIWGPNSGGGQTMVLHDGRLYDVVYGDESDGPGGQEVVRASYSIANYVTIYGASPMHASVVAYLRERALV